MTERFDAIVICALAMLPVLCSTAGADEVADFYRGKTINFTVSTGVGGGYDIYARPLARHMGKHVPGNPTIVVQNMVGGGGMRAINHLFNIAAKDGSVIGMVHSGLATSPLQGVTQVKFEATKFNWIGSMHKAGTVCLAWHTAPVKKFDDLYKTELVVGSTGPGSGFHIMATLLRNLFGAKFRIIAGYESGPHLLNSVERQETQGTCGIAMASIAISHPHWLRDKLVNFLVQTGFERDKRPELAGVPMAYEMAKTAEQKAVMDIMFANGLMDRPVLAPPGVPPARVAALRAALKATLEDREFRAEMEKSRVPIIHVPGEEVQALLARLYASPPSVLKAVAKAMAQ
jgi:tripartite-type tricarboxylate transporter receptor subunit TctC